ncbi:GNAT family N-acetyltransferase [Clostridium lundense]|uniref:GNAT family N-acetyltransferase n=1 Tax=Clostridium lundense TaxID=319475 RepID=UPI00048945D4|nr:GNAT family N-acetyltransferase [Clostridium lundense]
MLYLKEVIIENWKAVTSLSVSENQQGYIESNAFSLAESKFLKQWRPAAIYDNKELIGFAMYGYFDNEKRVWLDRFMIDSKYQGKGYGKKALVIIIRHIVLEYECKEIYLSIFKNNIIAEKLYKEVGFKFNGERDEGGEFVMVLNVEDFEKQYVEKV